MPSVNDDAEHVLYTEGASDALARGENVLDFWVPEMDEGFPQFLYYQNLPHLSVVAVQRLSFGVLDVLTAFNLVRYLLLVLFPLTVYWAMRRMDFDRVSAAVGGASSSLLATPYLYGFDYESYLWRGFGLYTQIWGMHLSFITLALLWRLIRHGVGFRRTAAAIAVLALSHLLYAYMMVVSAAILVAFGITRANAPRRLVRLAGAGAVALAVSAWMWLPYLGYRGFVNASPYLQPEKYASFGAPTILGWLVGGELTDHGRLPLFAVLLAVGAVAAVVTRARPALFALVLFAVWLVLYFGRTTLGPLASLLPLQETLLFHRFIGGVHIAAIMLIGVGGASLFALIAGTRTRPRLALASAALALAFVPALADRYAFDDLNGTWMRQTKTAIDADGEIAALVSRLRALPAGRVYAGLRSNWGERMDFAIPFRSVRVYQYLAFERFRTLAPPFGGASLNSDLQFDFNDQDAAQYDLYNVRYVLAPRDVAFPAFLTALQTTAHYALYAAPSSGHLEYVALSGREAITTQAELFPRNRAFVNGPGPAARSYLRWDYPASAPRAASVEVAGCQSGGVRYERIQASRFDFIAGCANAATALIKETYHPNWHATVDGAEAETFMLSPSYIGISLPPGDHFVTLQYRSTPMKMPLVALGLVVLVVLAAARRDLPQRIRDTRGATAEWLRRRRTLLVAARQIFSPAGDE